MDVRPIDANALTDIAKNKYCDIVAGRYPFNIVVYDLVQIIEKQPTLDLAPVVHGEWVNVHEGFMYYSAECSVCGNTTPSDYYYCPYCGAKMDGGKKDG